MGSGTASFHIELLMLASPSEAPFSVIAVMNSCSGDLRSLGTSSAGEEHELQYIPTKGARAANRVVSLEEMTHSYMQTICWVWDTLHS